MPARGVAVGAVVGDGGTDVELGTGVGGSVAVMKPGVAVESAGVKDDAHP
jgi:hypothetical protein